MSWTTRRGPSNRSIRSSIPPGILKAYNTDYLAIRKLLAEHRVPSGHSFILRGSGGMAKAVACALRDAGFRSGTIVARNETAGKRWPNCTDSAGGRRWVI